MTTGSHPQRRPSWVDDERALESGRGPIVPAEIVLEKGTLLAGKYRLDRPAGFGGMAQLWVATNESTGAEVCVKVLVPDAKSDESVMRFRREAHAAARLGHRAIVRVFDLVELDANGQAAQKGANVAALAIVMELLSGETLGDALMKRGKLPLEETLDIIIPVLSALAHAHRAGVVHRDVKPDNVFLAKDPDGHVIPKVLDFGISKLQGDKAQLTNDGVMLGTPSFMSPEQARGASKVDARSDVFSAAIMMVMMLSGKNPFDDKSFHSVVSAILVREVERVPEAPDALWEVIARALAKDPAARFADATEFGIAVRKAAGRQVITESGTGMRPVFDSVVTVPPVTPGASTDSSPLVAPPVEADVEDEGEVVGLPPKRSMLPLGAAVVAALTAVVTVLAVRGLGGAPSRTGGGEPRASATAEAPARAPSAAPAEPPRGAVEPPRSGVASAAPVEAASAPPPAVSASSAKPRAPAPTATPKAPKPPASRPERGSGPGKEPAIVRDPGF